MRSCGSRTAPWPRVRARRGSRAHHHVEGAIRQLRDQDPFAHDQAKRPSSPRWLRRPRERCSPSSTSLAVSGCSACRSRSFEPAGAVQQVLSLDTSVRRRHVQTTWATARAPCNASRSNVPATPCVPASATTWCDRPSSSTPTTRDHDQVAPVVGCGHIGMVHSYALEAARRVRPGRRGGDGDVRHRRRPRRPCRGIPRRDPDASVEAVVDAVDAVWVCTWTAAHREAVERAVERGPRGVLREAARTDVSRSANGSRRALATVPHQVGLVLRHAPVFARAAEHRRVRDATDGRSQRRSATTSTSRSRVMYGSTWRKDVAAAGGGTLIEHSIHDVDVLRWMLGDPESRLRPTRAAGSGTRASTTSSRHVGLRRRLGRPADERVAPGAVPRVEPAARDLLRGRPAVDRGRLPRSAPRADEPVAPRPSSHPLPEWAARLQVAEVYAKALAAYAAPSRRSWTHSRPTDRRRSATRRPRPPSPPTASWTGLRVRRGRRVPRSRSRPRVDAGALDRPNAPTVRPNPLTLRDGR